MELEHESRIARVEPRCMLLKVQQAMEDLVEQDLTPNLECAERVTGMESPVWNPSVCETRASHAKEVLFHVPSWADSLSSKKTSWSRSDLNKRHIMGLCAQVSVIYYMIVLLLRIISINAYTCGTMLYIYMYIHVSAFLLNLFLMITHMYVYIHVYVHRWYCTRVVF